LAVRLHVITAGTGVPDTQVIIELRIGRHRATTPAVGVHGEVDRSHGAIRSGHQEQDSRVKGPTKAVRRKVRQVGRPEAAGDEGVPGEADHRLPPAPESR
jgi:hypothetical protein